MRKGFIILILFALLPLLLYSTSEINELKTSLLLADSDQSKMETYFKLAQATQYTTYQESECYADSALQIANKINDLETQISVSLLKGNLLFSKKKPIEAYKLYHECLVTSIQKKNKSSQVQSLIHLSQFHANIKEYTNSIQYCKQALKVNADSLNQQQAKIYSQMGENYKNLNKQETALFFFRKALDIFKIHDNQKQNMRISTFIAKTYMDMEEFDTSIKISLDVIKMAESMNDKWIASLCFNDLGWAYQKKGNFEQSLKYNELALEYRRSLGINPAIQSTIINIAILYKNNNQIEKAIELLTEAHEMKTDDFSESDRNKNRSRYYKHLAELYSAKQDFENAYKFQKLYSTVTDSLQNMYKFNEISNLEIKYWISNLEMRHMIQKKINKQINLLILISMLFIFIITIALIYSKYKHKKQQNTLLQYEIEERTRVEQELKKSKKNLKILNKIIRHDVINDIAVIRSALNLYDKTSNQQMLVEIKKRVTKLVEQISYYKKYEMFIETSHDLLMVDVSKIALDLQKEFPNVSVSLNGKTASVYADDALYAVFTNLITNAINHGKASNISIAQSCKNGYCTIRFSDNGSGIPAEIQDKVFEEGFKYGDTGHTGIGLYIVKQIITGYGGEISVEDNEPKGTVFVITLKTNLSTL